jgi:hypothetical protein
VSRAAATVPATESVHTVGPPASEPATFAAALQLAITELQQKEEHDSAVTCIVGQPARLAAAASARNHRAAAKEQRATARKHAALASLLQRGASEKRPFSVAPIAPSPPVLLRHALHSFVIPALRAINSYCYRVTWLPQRISTSHTSFRENDLLELLKNEFPWIPENRTHGCGVCYTVRLVLKQN